MMARKTEDVIKKVTTELNSELVREMLPENQIVYHPTPHQDGSGQNVWRIRLDLSYDSRVSLGLDINGEVVLGRMRENGQVDLGQIADAEYLGVSRSHALLRPTENKLYILDQSSTNGTWLNNHSVGVNVPYSLSNGDLLRLGQLELIVRIVRQPNQATVSRPQTDLAEALPRIASSIVSQLDLPDVLKQTMQTALTFTLADEITIWLVDEQTGELFLETGQGANPEPITRLPTTDTLAGQVVKSGKPLRANRPADGGQVKLKTGYLVEAVLYVPLMLGGVAFGVIQAAHHINGRSFSAHDEKVMAAIADFTAIAVQNARLYRVAHKSSMRRSKVVTALSYALSYDLKNALNAMIGYAGLLENDSALDDETLRTATRIVSAGNKMGLIMDQLAEITQLCENAALQRLPLDLADVVSAAIDDLQFMAASRTTHLDFQMMGEPFAIQGDDVHLYRSVHNLVDNAIRYSPDGAQVSITLIFGRSEILIRVADTGPGFPEDDVPYLFDRYYRGSHDSESSLGLGLEYVRATVEAHRGTIIVRNKEPHGAEFIITLPDALRVSERSAES
jgi:signal transduction histidine kinase